MFIHARIRSTDEQTWTNTGCPVGLFTSGGEVGFHADMTLDSAKALHDELARVIAQASAAAEAAKPALQVAA